MKEYQLYTDVMYLMTGYLICDTDEPRFPQFDIFINENILFHTLEEAERKIAELAQKEELMNERACFFVYEVPVGIGEAHLVYYLINTSKKQHESLSRKIFGEWDERRWYEFITVASIVQKEAANKDEMALVASVIYNRLKIGMKLQMDGTLNYDLHSHEKITPKKIAQDKSRYNTYKYAGLPPSAVCNVSFDAIKAAIFPKKTNYLYFVRDKSTGGHIFSANYKSHLVAINRSNKAK